MQSRIINRSSGLPQYTVSEALRWRGVLLCILWASLAQQLETDCIEQLSAAMVGSYWLGPLVLVRNGLKQLVHFIRQR